MKYLVIAALAANLVAAGEAQAKEKPPVFVVTRSIGDKPVVTLDPAKGYILVRSAVAIPLYLMKVPSTEDQKAYDKLRAEAFAEARAKYAKKLASYEKIMKTAADTRVALPTRPVEPTEANFEFTAFGLMATVAIGPLYRFAKQDGGGSTYLQEVTPGSYRIYGSIFAGGQGAMAGTCFCMGSVKFDVPAGAVTDLGFVGQPAPLAVSGTSDSTLPVAIEVFSTPPATMGIDRRLAAAKITPATFRAVGKLPNYFGITIGRIPAMPGVIGYDRDRILDLAPAAVTGAATGQ